MPDVTNPTLISAFNPAIDAALAHGGILAVHEYAAPYMNATYSGGTGPGGSGWLTGRYRKWYEQYLIPSGRGKIPLAVTENGIDAGTCSVSGTCPPSAQGGWKGMCGFWASKGQSDCNSAYMAQLAWYDQVMRNDSYVLGSTIFSLEIGGWDDFDIGPMTDVFVQYLQQQT